MGNQLGVITKAINCQECSRYVCNACAVHSKCSGCCEVDVETTEVEREEAEIEIVKATTTAKEESGSMSRAILSYLSTRLA